MRFAVAIPQLIDDGAGSTTTARFAEQVKVVRDALDETGRDFPSFCIAKRVYIAVDDDEQRAREQVATSFVQIYGPQLGPRLLPVAVYGPPEACVRGLRKVGRAGAELILFTSFVNQEEQMEPFAAEIVPQLPDAAQFQTSGYTSARASRHGSSGMFVPTTGRRVADLLRSCRRGRRDRNNNTGSVG